MITKDLGAVSAYAYAVEQGYTGTEAEYAELMASYASVAEQASQSAQTATEKAQQASASATSASQSASSASASAQTAQTAQQTASTKASEAQQSAQTATTKAQEASQSASESSQSAQTAVQAKQDAQTAKTASETAQASAESARDDAESARDEAQQYAESIDPEKLIGAYPVDTASGSIASFTDGADNIPMKSVKVRIEPVQDLHGQESPYPAGGGKNKYSGQYLAVESVYINLFGTRSASNITTYGMDVKANTTYAVTIIMPSTLPTSARWGVYGRYAESTSNITFSINDVGATRTFTFTPAADTKVIMWGYLSGGETLADVGVTAQSLKIQIEEGTTATAWSPYENICPISGWDSVVVSHSGADTSDPSTITIPLGQTVYGGTLDVTTGELVVDRVNIASYNGETLPSEWISDRDVYSAGATPTTGAQVVYELATPITLTLTPTEIKSLLGDNNLWADTGESTVIYRADTTLYINRKIAEAVSALS